MSHISATVHTSHCLVHPSSHLNLMQMYTYLNKLPLACVIFSQHSRVTSLHLPVLIATIATLLLCGDIQLNLDPPVPSLCTYNIRLLLSNDHITSFHDLTNTHHPNLIALTDTWVNSSFTPSELANVTPQGYTLLSYPRTNEIKSKSKQNSNKALCSGTTFPIKEPASIIPNPTSLYTSLNISSVTLKSPSATLTVSIYTAFSIISLLTTFQ